MSTYTDSYGLLKPDDEDYYDVADFNENMDTIDTQMATMDAEITLINEEIGGMNQKLTTIDGKVTTANAGLITANNKLTTLDTNLTTANNSLTTINGKIVTLDSKVVDLDGDVAVVNGKIGASADKNDTTIFGKLNAGERHYYASDTLRHTLKSVTATTGSSTTGGKVSGEYVGSTLVFKWIPEFSGSVKIIATPSVARANSITYFTMPLNGTLSTNNSSNGACVYPPILSYCAAPVGTYIPSLSLNFSYNGAEATGAGSTALACQKISADYELTSTIGAIIKVTKGVPLCAYIAFDSTKASSMYLTTKIYYDMM